MEFSLKSMGWFRKIIGGGEPSGLSEDFEIELGPEWDPQHEDTHFSWANMENGRQIIISVTTYQQPVSKPEYYISALQQIATKQAIMRAGSPDVSFSDPISRDEADEVEFTVYGIVPSMPVQARIHSIANAKKIVVLTYYNYNNPLPENEFIGESEKIRAALKISR